MEGKIRGCSKSKIIRDGVFLIIRKPLSISGLFRVVNIPYDRLSGDDDTFPASSDASPCTFG